MGPRGFWIALAIVLFYLIARPHISTVWYIKEDRPLPTPSVSLPPGLTPINEVPAAHFIAERAATLL
jgi:hypothetical protein